MQRTVLDARRLADELLFPAAQAVDASGQVPRSHLDALAEAGLFGLFGPDGPPEDAVWDVFEAIAGGCGNTFFVWAQHHGPIRALRATANDEVRNRWLDRLCSDTLASIAFAYLRRPGPPAVTATETTTGWTLGGAAPWVTGWGLAEVVLVSAGTDDGRIVSAMVPADGPGLEATPLDLAAMGATSTVQLTFDRVDVSNHDVTTVEPADAWHARDRFISARPTPPPYGVADRCCHLLAGLDPTAAARLRTELERQRHQAMTTMASNDTTAMLEARAAALELVVRAALALVTATGGRGMGLDHPAQRLYREAGFYAVQASTRAFRESALARLG